MLAISAKKIDLQRAIKNNARYKSGVIDPDSKTGTKILSQEEINVRAEEQTIRQEQGAKQRKQGGGQ